MRKFMEHIYLYYVKSWDFMLSIALSCFYTAFIFTGKGNLSVYFNIVNDFSIFVPILTIFITLTLFIMLMTAPHDEFRNYLENLRYRDNTYPLLIEYHKAGFLIFFSALFLNIYLRIAYEFKDINILFKITCAIAVFLTVYSFFYMVSLIIHNSKITEYRIRYNNKYNEKGR